MSKEDKKKGKSKMHHIHVSPQLYSLLQEYGESVGTEEACWKFVEEAGELMKELNKNRCGKDNLPHVQEEIADALIMSLQLAERFGWNEIMKQVDEKRMRSERRLESQRYKKK